jgi:hypothetical protein
MTRSLERALETDLALTERQAQRQHSVNFEECCDAGLTITPAFIAPTARSSRRRWVNFVSLEPLNLEGFELRHIAGVAELRHLLGADPRSWQVLGHAAETSPDAMWHRGLEIWAVEFDAGAYTLKTVQRKARAFEAGFDGQVWGVASSERAQVLGDVLGSRAMLVRPF